MMGIICRHGCTDKTARRGRENKIERPNLHNSRVHLTEAQCRRWVHLSSHHRTSHLGKAPAVDAAHTPPRLPCCQSSPEANKTQGESSPEQRKRQIRVGGKQQTDQTPGCFHYPPYLFIFPHGKQSIRDNKQAKMT